MSLAPVIALALGLAMDATAVAAATGLAAPRLSARHYALVGACFGGAQGLMPLLGWLLGRWIGPALEAWDHWIAFGLLGGIGVKMLLEARRGEGAGGGADPAAPARDPFAPAVLLGLSIATSIDAFAAGIALPMFDVPIGASALAIGAVTAVLSAGGLALGHRVGARLGRGLETFGGLVLVGLGVKMLIQHL